VSARTKDCHDPENLDVYCDPCFASVGKKMNFTQLLTILPPSDTLPNAIDADCPRVGNISLRTVTFNFGSIALLDYAEASRFTCTASTGIDPDSLTPMSQEKRTHLPLLCVLGEM